MLQLILFLFTFQILKNFEEGLGFRCSVQFSDEEVDKPTAEDYENLKQILKDDGITEKPAFVWFF